MIRQDSGIFHLDTEQTSYIFEVTPWKHLEHIYYGPRLRTMSDIDVIRQKRTIQTGSTVMYDDSDSTYSLDTIPLEWSGIGRGDYRFSPIEAKMPDGTFITDFIYQDYTITKGPSHMQSLPSSYGSKEECQTLCITLYDEIQKTQIKLFYMVYEKCDVITRRTVITNHADTPITLRKNLSMMIDLPNRKYKMITFDGGWIRETHKHAREINYGMTVNSSTTGSSSNMHNPGFLVAEESALEDSGWVYGFNLIYSGNHWGSVELSNRDFARVAIGMNPHCFDWNIKKGESFETPEAIMTFSDRGYNEMSHHFHDFINDHIVRGDWKRKERPILINNWEADFFDFTQSSLLRLAGKAAGLGVELFVLDDGWFGERNNDHAGLGDYSVNKKKLPQGLSGLSKKIREKGMDFGLWFEPEMVNEESELYRKHPEYAVSIPGRKPTKGRNQLVLDLCKEEVRNYIVENVSRIIDETKLSYIKWDMNRHISEMFSNTLSSQGEFSHRYILGLYDVLKRIFEPRPQVLLESCSSGGNRFDLGMLCFSPQIWASDDTDPIERLQIQTGLSYLYPLSTFGAHVSMAPHQQTLRNTPLSTRFNVAAFGCLGYELDLKLLSLVENKEVKEQIAFYKEHRETFQYGIFSRNDTIKENKILWQVRNPNSRKAIAGFYQTLVQAAEAGDTIVIKELDPNAGYVMTTKRQNLYLERFGGLIKHALPVRLNPKGAILRTANQVYSLKDCVETYHGSGRIFALGIPLNDQFMGTGYHEEVRMLGDFGSNLYIVKQED